MLREGAILDGKYKLVRRIGVGGMGAVWLCEKLATYERFAVKFIHEHAMADESYCARFAREVAVLRGLRHPNIVDVFDWSVAAPGRRPLAWVVMEHLEGESLQDVLRRESRLPAALLTRIMLQVLDGVAAVHAIGIVHRDLSPANIFLVGSPHAVPRVKILDFGLAKSFGGSHVDTGVTRPGSMLGRAAYVAPELFLDCELDVRADIFACGMILYRALAGRFPYRERKVDQIWAERYAERMRCEPYAPPSRFQPDIPPLIEKIIMRAICRRPADRYPTATEMQKELLWADTLLPLGHRAVAALPDPPSSAGPAAAATTPPAFLAPGGIAVSDQAETGAPAAERSTTVRVPVTPQTRAPAAETVVVIEPAGAGGGSVPSAAAEMTGYPSHVRPARRRPAGAAAAAVAVALVGVLLALLFRGDDEHSRPQGAAGAVPQAPSPAAPTSRAEEPRAAKPVVPARDPAPLAEETAAPPEVSTPAAPAAPPAVPAVEHAAAGAGTPTPQGPPQADDENPAGRAAGRSPRRKPIPDGLSAVRAGATGATHDAGAAPDGAAPRPTEMPPTDRAVPARRDAGATQPAPPAWEFIVEY